MTTKGIYFYSLTGKTEAALELIDGIKMVKLNNVKSNEFTFESDEIIIIGSPTYGRGLPPLYFKEILPQLRNLVDKRIGLFGSGNTIYGEQYCGALDVLEEILNVKNKILFKFKFEGYPTDEVKAELEKLIMKG